MMENSNPQNNPIKESSSNDSSNLDSPELQPNTQNNKINLASTSPDQIPKRKSKKNILIAVIVLLALLAAAGSVFYYLQYVNKKDSGGTKNTEIAESKPTPENPKVEVVNYTSNGFDNQSVVLSDGSVLVIKNNTDSNLVLNDSTANTQITIPSNSEYEYIVVSENKNEIILESKASPLSSINIRVNE